MSEEPTFQRSDSVTALLEHGAEINEAHIAELEQKLRTAEKEVEEIRSLYTLEQSGHSSFYDVTGNLLAKALPSLRYVKEAVEGVQDPEDEEDAALFYNELKQSVELLEKYIKLLKSDPKLLNDEATLREGANSALRQEADQAAKENAGVQAIPYYVGLLVRQQEIKQLEQSYAQPAVKDH
jgi:hypothetical protein